MSYQSTHCIIRREPAPLPQDFPADLPPLLAQVYASRGVSRAEELSHSLEQLIPYHQLKGTEQAVALLVQALERGFLDSYDPKRDVPARFVTVIITPKGNPANIQKIEDFARPGVRVGLGNPKSCAIGIWHEKTFKKAGIWDQVKNNATLSLSLIHISEPTRPY